MSGLPVWLDRDVRRRQWRAVVAYCAEFRPTNKRALMSLVTISILAFCFITKSETAAIVGLVWAYIVWWSR